MMRMYRDRTGFVLVASLFLLLVVSAVLLQDSLRSRVRREQMIRDLDRMRARAAAEAGVQDALVRLDRLQEESAGDPDRASATWSDITSVEELRGLEHIRMNDTRYSISLSDVGEKLPINDASPSELAQLFAALGVEPDRADMLIRVILARRSAPAAGTSDSTSGRFASPDELRAIPGARSEDVDRIASALTGFNGGHVNVNTAPEAVLHSLPGLDDDAIAWILRRRSYRPIRAVEEISAGLSAGSHKFLMQSYFALVQRATFSLEAVEIAAVGEAGDPVNRARVHAIAARTPAGFQVVWEDVQ